MRQQLDDKARIRLLRLGADIDLARSRRKITAKAVCKEAQITPQTYQRLVDGEPGVSLGVLLSVLRVIGLDQTIESVARSDQDTLGLWLASDDTPHVEQVPR